MARYYYHLTNYHHRHRHIKRLKRFFLVILIVALVAAAVIAVDTLRPHKEQPSAPSKVTTSVQQASVAILRTEYFQFQAPPDWVEISNQSTSQKFVYREINSTNIKNQLDIYVNNPPKELFAEYVLPVTVKDDHASLMAGTLSDHCKKAVPKPLNENSLTVTYEGVTFGCHFSGTAFIVVAGQKGGTTDIKLIRPNGQPITYTLVYRDLTADPTGDDFAGILNSFQAR
jgi:hypothetical protein